MTQAKPTRPQRRSQTERSTEMRRKLCEAALQLLTETGYERLTMALIAERAAVSKGAQSHHFPAKADVLVGAFEHLLAGWKVRREQFVDAHPGPVSVDATLRYLWKEVFSRPDYIAAIELMLASRYDLQLKSRLQAVLATWTIARDDMFRQIVDFGNQPEEAATFLQLNFCVLRGMAIYDSLSPDTSMNARVLDMWVEMAGAHFGKFANHVRDGKSP